MAAASDNLAPAPSTAEDDCFWLYSSGTTGTPKGAVHRHRDMVVTSEHYGVGTLGLRADDVCFSAAKLFFAYGLGNAMTFPLWVGATAVLLPGAPTPDSTFEVIERDRPGVFYGVPTLYAALLKALEAGPRDLSSLRVCVSAGEAPTGGHLPALEGARWRRDNAFFEEYHRVSRTRDGFLAWLDEWVLAVPDHAAYRAKLGRRHDDLWIVGSAPAAATDYATA